MHTSHFQLEAASCKTMLSLEKKPSIAACHCRRNDPELSTYHLELGATGTLWLMALSGTFSLALDPRLTRGRNDDGKGMITPHAAHGAASGSVRPASARIRLGRHQTRPLWESTAGLGEVQLCLGEGAHATATTTSTTHTRWDTKPTLLAEAHRRRKHR